MHDIICYFTSDVTYLLMCVTLILFMHKSPDVL